MKDKPTAPMTGAVEADETYVGGRKRATETTPLGYKKLAHGPGDVKTTVFEMLQRAQPGKPSTVRAMVVPDRKSATLLPVIARNVVHGSILYTDAWQAYRTVRHDYEHYFVDHAVKYVEGHVTTNRIEDFWSYLKRTISSTYICPRGLHLDAYLDEQVFRFNARGSKDEDRSSRRSRARAVVGSRWTRSQVRTPCGG